MVNRIHFTTKVLFFLLFSLVLPSISLADNVNDLLRAIYENKVEDVGRLLVKGVDPDDHQVLHSLIASDPRTIDFLFDNKYRKIDPDLFCDFLKNLAWRKYFAGQGMSIFISKPWLILDAKYKNLDVKSSSISKIPRILHHIWLTNEEQKKEILGKDIKNIFKTHEIFLQSGKDWEHIVWVNDRDLVPNSTKVLEASGIKVKEIASVKKHFRLGAKIDELIEQGRWGMASDSLRYELINYYGGIYADLNYIFARDLEREIHRYDFFSQTYNRNGDISINNFIFGAKPNHPVLIDLIGLVYENFYNPSEYIKSLTGRAITDETTAVPTGTAYYRAANNGTTDVVYPYIDFDDASDGSDRYDFRFSSDERKFQKEVMKKKISILKRHANCVKDIDFIEGMVRFNEYLYEHEICGTKDHLIGEDSKDGLTWINPEWDL